MSDENESSPPWGGPLSTRPLDMVEMDALVEKSVAAWDAYEKAKKVASEAFKEAEAIDNEIMAALRDAGKDSYKAKAGTVTLSYTENVRVPASIEDKQKFFAYLKTISEDFMWSKVTINSQTLNSWYREKAEEARAQGKISEFKVPGLEAPSMRETLRFRAAKKGS